MSEPLLHDVQIYAQGHEAFSTHELPLDIEHRKRQFEFEALLAPTPETDQFRDEMDNPIRITDEVTGINYGVYQVNRDKDGDPLILNMSWSVAAGKKPGRQEVKAYAARLDRPITVIDMEAHGETDVPKRSWRKGITFDEIAAAHLRIIDQLGIDKFDIEGMSMGGVVAAKIAQQAGERVGALITVSTVSYEQMSKWALAKGFVLKEGKHQKRYVKEAPESVRQEAGVGFVGSMKSIPTLARLAMMMTNDVVPEAVEGLSPATKWYDFVGSAEEVTNYKDHLRTVRERNRINPRSSSIYVLGSETHSWGVHINGVAQAVATVLKRSKHTH